MALISLNFDVVFVLWKLTIDLYKKIKDVNLLRCRKLNVELSENDLGRFFTNKMMKFLKIFIVIELIGLSEIRCDFYQWSLKFYASNVGSH